MKTIQTAISEICVLTPQGANFTLPSDFPAFNGHFPNNPVLPAVVMVMMAVYAITQKEGSKLQLKCMKKAKITTPISVGDTAEFLICKKGDYYEAIVQKDTQRCALFQIELTANKQ
ncbi:hypothetical protein FACS189487_03720 [Campylobacterota bacterium]|nr:hypothetical protein FACS189487_03720 [Campylobacterota bacterium]